MKKYSLALLVAANCTTAYAAEIYNKDNNALEVYGKIKAKHAISENEKANGDTSYLRIGLRGRTQINEDLSGYGQWEYQYNLNNSEGNDSANGNKTRLGFAGLKHTRLGSVDYGRNYGVLYDVEAWTDMFPEFGGDGSVRADNYMMGRANGLLTWRTSDFFGLVDGLRIALQYQGKNDSNTANSRTDNNLQNGDGFGASVGYSFADTGISIIGALSSSNRTNAQQTASYGKGDKAEAIAGGIKYDANHYYLAAIYSEMQNITPLSGTNRKTGVKINGAANSAQNIELVAQYQFDNGFRPSLGYIQTAGKNIENGIGNTDLVKYIDVGASYYFNKNMSAFVDYKINQIAKDNRLTLNTDDIVAIGLTYQF